MRQYQSLKNQIYEYKFELFFLSINFDIPFGE